MSNSYREQTATRIASSLNPLVKVPEPDTCEHITNTMLDHTVEELGKAISNLESRLNSVLNPANSVLNPAVESPCNAPPMAQVDGTFRRKLFDLRDKLDNQIRWVNEITSRINV